MAPLRASTHIHAIVAWLAGAALLALILTLAGALPVSTGILDLVSVTSACGVLLVLALLYAELRPNESWGLVGLTLAISGLTLVLVGDALQHVVFDPSLGSGSDKASLWALSVAIRDVIGNSLFFASLLVAGGLLIASGSRWLGWLAVANGILGYLDLLFANALHLPPHTNFLVLVVWLVLLGARWWRTASISQRAPSRAPALAPTESA